MKISMNNTTGKRQMGGKYLLLIEQRADLFNRVLPKNQSKPKQQQNQPRENVGRGKEWAIHLKIQMAKRPRSR